MTVLLQTRLPLSLFCRGKVRDVYDLGDKLLIVSTDRISAFDFVLPCGIPDKGKVLNQLSAFWFKKTAHILPNHLITAIDNNNTLRELGKLSGYSGKLPAYLLGRSMIVAKAQRISVECVVRGYLSGSAWTEYERSGTVSDVRLPSGLRESQELPQPLFTPTTKSETEHDRPLTEQDVETLGVKSLMPQLEELSLLIYQYARDWARDVGIIVADTKFEFGLVAGELVLIDEALTPDSSRFWSAREYEVGHSQPSLDKQPVRDWLTASGWNKQPPVPTLPLEVVEATTERYTRIHRLFVGKDI